MYVALKREDARSLETNLRRWSSSACAVAFTPANPKILLAYSRIHGDLERESRYTAATAPTINVPPTTCVLDVSSSGSELGLESTLAVGSARRRGHALSSHCSQRQRRRVCSRAGARPALRYLWHQNVTFLDGPAALPAGRSAPHARMDTSMSKRARARRARGMGTTDVRGVLHARG
mmetsp:Transcript_15945/g.38201  ORF Transcript_15945/g.38201 Transcript_15945/m.38201 type:complete len:177 (+) Transcript_15945:141-671(+)